MEEKKNLDLQDLHQAGRCWTEEGSLCPGSVHKDHCRHQGNDLGPHLGSTQENLERSGTDEKACKAEGCMILFPTDKKKNQTNTKPPALKTLSKFSTCQQFLCYSPGTRALLVKRR